MLYDIGYLDFAGSGVVHLTGGVGALIGSIMVGPRLGRFHVSEWEVGKEKRTSDDGCLPHNLPSVATGTLILWFGWYGFNCGSTLSMTGFGSAQSAALVAVNTTLAPAAGGISAGFLRKYFFTGSWSVVDTCGGILAGLVSITAGCGNVHPASSIFIGSFGARASEWSSALRLYHCQTHQKI